jgi:hypothetical protein
MAVQAIKKKCFATMILREKIKMQLLKAAAGRL